MPRDYQILHLERFESPPPPEDVQSPEKVWERLASRPKGLPIPERRKHKSKQPSKVTTLGGILDLGLRGIGSLWETGIEALTYTNASVMKGIEEATQALKRGDSASSAGTSFAKGVIKGLGEYPGGERAKPEMFMDTTLGEAVRRQAYQYIHNPLGDPIIAREPYSIGETVAAEVASGAAGVAVDVWSDPLTYAFPYLIGPRKTYLNVLRGRIAATEGFKALRASKAIRTLHRGLQSQLKKLYIDVGAPKEVVAYYRDFANNSMSYSAMMESKGVKLYRDFVAGAKLAGMPEDKAVLYMLDVMRIKKVEDIALLPKDIQAPILKMHRMLKAKGTDLFEQGLIPKLLAEDKLYLPRAIEMVKGPPAPKIRKLPKRANFKTEEEYSKAYGQYEEARAQLVEHYKYVRRSRYASKFDPWNPFYIKERKIKSFEGFMNFLNKAAKFKSKESPRAVLNFMETGAGALISMNTRLEWNNLMVKTLGDTNLAMKLAPGVAPKPGWIPVRFAKFPKPIKETLAGKLRYEELIGEIAPIAEEPGEALNQAYKLVKDGESVWLMDPDTLTFIRRMRKVHTPQGRSAMFVAYMNTLNLWKRMATYMRVAFNSRNYQSALEFAYLSGVRPDRIGTLTPEAFKLLTKPEGTVIGHSSWRLAKLFKDEGIYSRGFMAADVQYNILKKMNNAMRRDYFFDILGVERYVKTTPGELLKQGGRIIRAPFHAVDRGMRAGSIWIEDMGRSLTALNEILTKEKALGRKLKPKELREFIRTEVRNKVNAYHGNYAEVTPELRWLKAYVPFAKFPVWNQRMMWEKLFKNPERLMQYAKFKRGIFPDLAQDDIADLSERDYMRLGNFNSIPMTVKDAKGNDQPAFIRYHIDLPTESQKSFWSLKGFTQMLTPAATIASIITMNRTVQGIPIGELEGERVPAPFWATWLDKSWAGSMLDLGTMISSKTGKPILGMNPQARYLIEMVLPPLREASRAYTQEGEVFYSDEQGAIKRWVMSSGVQMKLMTKPEMLKTLYGKERRAKSTLRRLKRSRPEDSLEELLNLMRKNVELPKPKKSKEGTPERLPLRLR